ncbi:Uncharacterized protein TPAR_08427 [Tolypocladium paradoxum]|uniref:HNH nuclease domain-containing protein n=1 Tax=Tolypocladium paradoxum TaxID=94208 RepID=A0A2S4KME4_9HYPO|nr:Uncharacterized protein TPAR_08427 [Tolypocladium paradoxum]
MYAQWPYHLEDCRRGHAGAHWDALKIPRTLLETPQVAQSSALLALPNEILLQIIAHAGSLDQLFLALTCKTMLAISSMTTIIIPSAPRHRADRLSCSAMLALLHTMQPRRARGHPKKSWAPCCVCYRYRPKRKSYWKRVVRRYEEELSCGILAGYDLIVDSWSRKGSSSYECPGCWCEERIKTSRLPCSRFIRFQRQRRQGTMRLRDFCFTPDFPSHFRSHVSIWHPGYIRGEDTMFSLPRLDAVGQQDETDDEADVPREAIPREATQYGVHFGTMLLSCQIIAGNAFETAYLSYDRKGNNRVQLSRNGILIHDHYFLHVSQGDGTDTTSYAITPNFQEWRFSDALPEPWHSLAPTPRDNKPSCIISGSLTAETAHVIPQSHDKWYTDNAMCDYSQGAKSVSNSDNNICRLRVDLHRVFDKRAFALVPKPDDQGQQYLVVHFFSIIKDLGDTAIDIHNRKVHSLDSIAPEFLFARFALTVFACIKDFILRGERRRIAIVHRGIDANGSPAWVTQEVHMDRAQRYSRYGGGGSRGSSPSKRSRQSESQPGDDQERISEYGYNREQEEEFEEAKQSRSRTRSWVVTNAIENQDERTLKRRRTSRGKSPPSLTTSLSSRTTLIKEDCAIGPTSAGPDVSGLDEYHGGCIGKEVRSVKNGQLNCG